MWALSNTEHQKVTDDQSFYFDWFISRNIVKYNIILWITITVSSTYMGLYNFCTKGYDVLDKALLCLYLRLYKNVFKTDFTGN